MNKCLVTRLNGSVHDSSLLRLSEMRIRFDKVVSTTEHAQAFKLGAVKPIQLEIVGDGYFTDKTLTQNLGKTKTISSDEEIWVSNGAEIAILDKYSLMRINKLYSDNITFNISDLKYSTALADLRLYDTQLGSDIANLKNLIALTDLYLYNTQVSGDIANLKNLTSLRNLYLYNTQVSGDIANLKNLTSVSDLYLYNTQVSGDIANLKDLTTVRNLSLENTQVSGDIANLKNLTALTSLSLSNKQQPLTGDISQLSVLSNCTRIILSYSKLSGDLAILPSECRFTSFYEDKGSVFTWSTRTSTAKIIAIEGNAKITNIDKMLQDQAQCQIGFSSNDDVRFKTISALGTRTSASDAAVQTLQKKGYTVSVTPA